tara:strand:+ start:267 stop:956 length:690 start_codon:yes stop_codon:yes gene_type:complete
MSDLIKIGKKYPSSKNKFGFIHIYEKYFSDFRNKEFNLIEIGIDKGDSLRIWREFFPKAHICGLDIDKKEFKIDGVEFFFGDQSDNTFLKSVTDKCKSFDIIIDDGSHVSEHVISSFDYLYPFLNNNGLYIIEDLQTSYIPRYGGSRIRLNKKNTSMNFFKKLSDSVNYEHYNRPFYRKSKFDGLVKSVNFYQNIIFVRKGVTEKYYHTSNVKNSLIEFLKTLLAKFFS